MKKILLITTILIISIYIINNKTNKNDNLNVNPDIKENENKIEEKAILNQYTIYGRFLNLNLYIKDANDAKLILKSNTEELEYNLLGNDNLYLSDKINDGINLDKIKKDNYQIFVKTNNKYYKIKNNTKNNDLIYYKTKSNEKITISFNKNSTLKIEEENNKNIYDIIIDPGHGGEDLGAYNKKNNERQINLDNAILIKNELQSLGYKVKLTRETLDGINRYGDNSRTSIPYETKAKLMLSFHLNSGYDKTVNGFEIYTPYNIKYDFAKIISSNIVNNTSLKYSINNDSKIENGIYTRTLSKKDIEELKDEAIENNYTPYDIKDNTPYYYFIRETGGILTNAYADGRDPRYGENKYYNSNHGVESYLLEIGYISNNNDLNIILNEKNKIAKQIAISVNDYLK